MRTQAKRDIETAWRRRWSPEQKVQKAAYMANWREQNRTRIMWFNAKRRALASGLPFTITVADIQDAWPHDGMCPVLGLTLRTNNRRGPSPDSPTLDRLNPEMGYVPGNITVISSKANIIKSDATMAEVEAVLAWMKRRLPAALTL